nr:hypothetical protein Itr_chr10CG13420 [Ipomoea trifida]
MSDLVFLLIFQTIFIPHVFLLIFQYWFENSLSLGERSTLTVHLAILISIYYTFSCSSNLSFSSIGIELLTKRRQNGIARFLYFFLWNQDVELLILCKTLLLSCYSFLCPETLLQFYMYSLSLVMYSILV